MKIKPITALLSPSTRMLVAIAVALVLIALPMSPAHAAACTFTSKATGNWTAAATWNPTGGACSTYPGQTFAGDTVVISVGNTVTVDTSPAQNLAALTVNGTLNNNTTGNDLPTVGSLTVNSGSTFNVSRDLTVSGTTSITGTIHFASTSGTSRAMSFGGDVTLNNGAVWTEPASGFGGNDTFSFAGNFTNNATTFTALSTGGHSFTGAAKTISGSTVTSFPTVTVSGTITNSGTLTVTTTLAGAGTLTNAATGTLNIGAATVAPTLAATAVGNTVNYNGAAQTVKATTYDKLGFSGSGTKTNAANFAVNDKLNIATGTSATVNTGVNITAGRLAFGGADKDYGVWGSSTSAAPAAHQNNTFFAGSGVVTVSKATLTITASNASKTYGQTMTFAGTEYTQTGLVSGDSITSLTLTSTGAPAAAGAGSYNIVPSSASGTNVPAKYVVVYVDGTLTVAKADAVISVTGFNGVYDGAAHGATGTAAGVEASPANLNSLLHVAATTYTNVPGGAVAWTFDGNTNYNAASGSANVVITKATATVTLGSLSQTYDGTPRVATATTNPASLTVGFTYDGSATAPTNAGSYAVVGTINDTNYAGTASDTLVVDKADADIVVTPYSVTYDGKAHTATATAVGVETVPADLSGLLDLTGTTHTDAGTYGTDAWSFTGNTNYNSDSGTVSDAIAKADAVIVVTGFNGVYDGTAHGATGTAAGVETVPANLDSLLHVDATTYTDVPGGSVAWTFDGNTNYNSDSGSATVTITKANPVVNVTPYSVTYDGKAHTATATAVGVETVPADLSGLLDLSGTTHTTAGSYNGDIWMFSGNGNYNAAAGTVDDAIGKADAVITVTGFSGPYDGAAHGASGTAAGVETVPANLDSLLHVDATTYTDVPGGSVAWTFDGNTNYNSDSGSATVTITKVAAVINVTGFNGAYDGAAHGATGTAAGVEAVPANLDSLLHVAATTYTDVPGGTVAWTFDGDANYNSDSGSASVVITKANAVINVSGFTGTYDGLSHGATGTAVGVEAVPADLNSLLHVDATTYTNVPGGAVAWTFDGNTNYNSTSGSATVTINKADATCTVTPYNVVVDGADHTATGSCTGVGGVSDVLTGLDLTGTTHSAVGDYLADPWTFTDATGNYNNASGTVHDVIAAFTAPVFSPSATTLNFGLVKKFATSAPKVITITNTGNADLTISSVALSGTNASLFTITGQTCTAAPIVGPTGTCTVSVTFRPTTMGAKTASVDFTDNAGGPHSVALTGKGGLEKATNGGFNTFLGTSRIPNTWAATNFGSTDGKNTLYKKEGTASVKVTNTSPVTKTLAQTKTLYGGAAGNVFQLSAWAKGSSIPTTSGLVRVQVQLYKGGTLVQTKYLTFPNGTYVWTQRTVLFTAAGAYDRAVIKVIYSKRSGSVYFDGLSLLRGN